MLPTLLGRWQMRSLWLLVLGVPISAGFGVWYGGMGLVFVILLYVWSFGLCWDVLYQRLQARRWDGDWPAIYQVAAGLWEMGFLWGVLQFPFVFQVWGVNAGGLTWERFAWHYGAVFWAVFLATQTLHRILFVRARFEGGSWL